MPRRSRRSRSIAAEIPAGLELVRKIKEAPGELGSASIGAPNHGRLWGAARLMPSDDIQPEGDQPWGTALVVHAIERAAREVRRCFADTPRLFVGDISRKEGGWLKPHRSHQSGLDADIGYYYANGEGWFMTATADNLDRPRTWALVRALVEGGNVESMFIDRAVQRLLREYAETLDEPGPRLVDLFESKERKHDVVIHHASGHATHFHVRFADPSAQALGARLATLMTVPKPGSPRPTRGFGSELEARRGERLLEALVRTSGVGSTLDDAEVVDDHPLGLASRGVAGLVMAASGCENKKEKVVASAEPKRAAAAPKPPPPAAPPPPADTPPPPERAARRASCRRQRSRRRTRQGQS